MIRPAALAYVRIEGENRRIPGVWLPLFLLWPFVPVLLVLLVACGTTWAAVKWDLRLARLAVFGPPQVLLLLCALRGLRVRVDAGDAQVNVRFI